MANPRVLLAGYASADISLEVGEAYGPFLESRVREIAAPLMGRVVYLEEVDGDGPVVLAMADHIGFTRKADRRIRVAIARAVGISRSRVLLNASHNHAAPAADLATQEILNPHGFEFLSYSWLGRMKAAFVDAACRAKEERRQATVEAGMAPVEKVGAIRGVRHPDGSIATRYGVAPPELQPAPEGLIDPDVLVLCLRGEDGRPIVSILNYACHVTALRQRGEVIHPDFPHFALEVIEWETGGPGFFLQGAAGNVGTGKYADGTLERSKELGERLARGVLEAMEHPVSCRPGPLRLKGWKEIVELDPELPSVEETRRQLAELLESSPRRAWMPCAMLQVIEDPEAARRCELFLLSGGDWCLACLPAESFVEFGLAIRASSPTPFTLVGAYYDCTLWYIPTWKSMRDGGFESQGGWRYTAAGAGEQLAGSVIRRLGDLRKEV